MSSPPKLEQNYPISFQPTFGEKPLRAYTEIPKGRKQMRSKKVFDGGGFPMFTSYHDYRLPYKLVGPLHTDHNQFREAFKDFVKALNEDPSWRHNFDAAQVQAIDAAIRTNSPRIRGFVWHHHQDHGVLQLVSEQDHRRIQHYGGRFTSGGRPG